jgi:hypothetical protein
MILMHKVNVDDVLFYLGLNSKILKWPSKGPSPCMHYWVGFFCNSWIIILWMQYTLIKKNCSLIRPKEFS